MLIRHAFVLDWSQQWGRALNRPLAICSIGASVVRVGLRFWEQKNSQKKTCRFFFAFFFSKLYILKRILQLFQTENFVDGCRRGLLTA